MKVPQLLKRFDLEDIVGLDFETYFAQGYSLRSQDTSTSEYVRDRRFKAQCVGLQRSKERSPYWYAPEDIEAGLAEIDWSRTGVLAHNAAFDGFILSQHYGIVPKMYFCSMSMARPIVGHDIGAGLDEVARYYGLKGKVKADALAATKGIRDLPDELLNPLGEYCADDVSDMWRIFRKLLASFPELELELIDITIRAFASPVAVVDIPRVTAELEKEIKERLKLVRRVGQYVGVPKNVTGEDRIVYIGEQLSSNPKFAEALQNVDVQPPMKPSPSNPDKRIFAFAKGDLEFQALEHHSDKRVRDLVAARLNVKSTIGETRARRMLLRGTTGDKKLPLLLNYGKARTLRWTGGDKFNPQNFTRGGELRRSIKAPRGYKIIVVDSGQIEARMNAWVWEQTDLLDVFRQGGDPYCEMASEVYGKKITKKNYKERFVGKVAVLGLGYQMGPPKFQYTLEAGLMGPPVHIELELAEKVVSIYRKKNHKIVAGWRYLEQRLADMMSGVRTEELKDILLFGKQRVYTVSGFTLQYTGLTAEVNHHTGGWTNFTYKNKGNSVHIYGGKFNENIIQHLARLVVAEQMVHIARRYRIITMTHDEVVYLAPTREAKKAYEFGLECLTTPPDWCSDIPLSAEGGFDDVYSK